MELNRLTETRYGKMLYNRNDTIIGRSLELYGEWYQSEMDLMKPYIPKGGVCVDVGANIGCHTLFFAQAVGPAGIVMAIEPQHIVYQLLCANVALNDHLNVWALNVALGEANGLVYLPHVDYLKEGNFGAIRVGGQEGHLVQQKPLDDYAFPALDFMKIDVEGWESHVIQGAIQTIQKYQPFIFAENYPKFPPSNLIRLLQSLTYDVYQFNAPAYNPQNYKQNPFNFHGNYREPSVFCVPKSKKLILDLPLFV